MKKLLKNIITIFMVIPLLKKLLADTSAEEIRRVEDILESNDILYRINTVRSRGNIGTALDSIAYAKANLAMYKGGGTPPVVYEIFVWPRDLAKAKALITKKVD